MEVPRHWRLKKQRYSLTGEICPDCKSPVFPPRAVCPHCGGDAKHEFTPREQNRLAIAETVQPAAK
ncbi:MAG: hypothetical protein EHM21_01520 [Chloroflexi bacterium]|nr:MAG: hypothetical protein EHM21_01520 [Chloroflexota bacterium]